MDKSPISLLQEIFIKEGFVPTYSFTFAPNQGFTCTVTCKNLSASGTGNNKKEAKQNAAQNMLLLIEKNERSKTSVSNQVQDTIVNKIQVPISTEVCETINKNLSDSITLPISKQTIPECNYVGLLQELCTKYNLLLPVYTLIEEDGPSHMKIFTMEGNIESLKMKGKAHCKKSAKQAAAQNLLQLLVFLKKIPIEAFTTNKYHNEIFDLNNLHISNTETSDIQIEESILPPVKDISETALLNYVKSNCNSSLQNNHATVQNNHLTFMNTHTNVLQAKPNVRDQCYKQTSENVLQKIDLDNSIAKINESVVSISLEKSLNKIPSVYTKLDSVETSKKSSAIKYDQSNMLLTALVQTNNDYKRTLEDDMRKFNVEISDVTETLPISEVSKNKDSIHTTLNADAKMHDSLNEDINSSHVLFKKLYSHLISDDLKEKMQRISTQDAYNKPLLIQETCKDIQRILGVKLKLISCNNYGTDHVVYLRMLSKPIITQVGTGKTVNEAETRAMYEIINTILDFLK